MCKNTMYYVNYYVLRNLYIVSSGKLVRKNYDVLCTSYYENVHLTMKKFILLCNEHTMRVYYEKKILCNDTFPDPIIVRLCRIGKLAPLNSLGVEKEYTKKYLIT
jgi:hypothetical protein